MENKEMVEIIDVDGLKKEVEVVTYLNSEDNKRQYLVYTKGEVVEETQNQVIYIARIVKEEAGYTLVEITEDTEWIDVQHLLKKIANVQSVTG